MTLFEDPAFCLKEASELLRADLNGAMEQEPDWLKAQRNEKRKTLHFALGFKASSLAAAVMSIPITLIERDAVGFLMIGAYFATVAFLFGWILRRRVSKGSITRYFASGLGVLAGIISLASVFAATTAGS